MNRHIFQPQRRHSYGDPVSAIVAAIGASLQGAGQIAQAVGGGKQAQAELTMQSNEYILAQQQAEASARNMKVIGGIAVVGVVGVIATVLVWRATSS